MPSESPSAATRSSPLGTTAASGRVGRVSNSRTDISKGTCIFSQHRRSRNTVRDRDWSLECALRIKGSLRYQPSRAFVPDLREKLSSVCGRARVCGVGIRSNWVRRDKIGRPNAIELCSILGLVNPYHRFGMSPKSWELSYIYMYSGSLSCAISKIINDVWNGAACDPQTSPLSHVAVRGLFFADFYHGRVLPLKVRKVPDIWVLVAESIFDEMCKRGRLPISGARQIPGKGFLSRCHGLTPLLPAFQALPLLHCLDPS